MEKYNKSDLERMILKENMSYLAIGRLYSVSGNAIKKAALRLNITIPQRRVVNNKETFNRFKKSIIYNIENLEFINIIETSFTWSEISIKLKYKNLNLSRHIKASIRKRCSELNINLRIKKLHPIINKTKKIYLILVKIGNLQDLLYHKMQDTPLKSLVKN